MWDMSYGQWMSTTVLGGHRDWIPRDSLRLYGLQIVFGYYDGTMQIRMTIDGEWESAA